MHKRTVCPNCGKSFDYTTTYNKHTYTCKSKPVPNLGKKKLMIARKKSQDSNRPNHPIHIDNDPAPMLAQIQTTIGVLTQRMKQLQEQIDNNPTIINNYNFINNYPGLDAYNKLVDSMGKDQAINFIAQAAQHSNIMDVFKKAFLSDKSPNDYPIAEKNDMCRYLDNNGYLVEKPTETMSKIIRDQIQYAMIKATSELINHKISTNSVDELYDMYDIRSIQNFLANMDDIEIATEIANEINNPGHPFFEKDMMHIT